MQIGFIGSGSVATSIARRAIAAGHDVRFSSRSGRSAEAAAAQLGARASAVSIQAAAEAAIVILAVRWPDIEEALASLPDWNGRVLVDATNHFASFQPLTLADLHGETSTGIVAGHAPGARVVKAFNSLSMTQFNADLERGGARRVVFVSGDDKDAKATVGRLIGTMGLAALDLGDLATGGRTQQAGGPLAGKEIFLAG